VAQRGGKLREAERVAGRLEAARRDLLDMTLRNSLLNFRQRSRVRASPMASHTPKKVLSGTAMAATSRVRPMAERPAGSASAWP
jgi:hypothetical protein